MTTRHLHHICETGCEGMDEMEMEGEGAATPLMESPSDTPDTPRSEDTTSPHFAVAVESALASSLSSFSHSFNSIAPAKRQCPSFVSRFLSSFIPNSTHSFQLIDSRKYSDAESPSPSSDSPNPFSFAVPPTPKKECCCIRAAKFVLRHWKWFVLSLIICTILAYVITSAIMLKIRTGSFFYHNVAWYDGPTTARRNYPEIMLYAQQFQELQRRQCRIAGQSEIAGVAANQITADLSPNGRPKNIVLLEGYKPGRMEVVPQLQCQQSSASDSPVGGASSQVNWRPFSCLLPDPCTACSAEYSTFVGAIPEQSLPNLEHVTAGTNYTFANAPSTPQEDLLRQVFAHSVTKPSQPAASEAPVLIYTMASDPSGPVEFFQHVLMNESIPLQHADSVRPKDVSDDDIRLCSATRFALPAVFKSTPSSCFAQANTAFIHLVPPLTAEQLPFIHDLLVIGEHYETPILVPMNTATKAVREWAAAAADQSQSGTNFKVTSQQNDQLKDMFLLSQKFFDLRSVDASDAGNVLSMPVNASLQMPLVSPDFRQYFIGLTDENCVSPDVLKSQPTLFEPDSSLRLIYQTYDDCHLVNGERGFLWPLGPSADQGFTRILDEIPQIPSQAREFKMNLAVTFHPEKPTRMQAALAAKKWCDEASSGKKLGTRSGPVKCHLSQTNFWHKALEFFEKKLFSAAEAQAVSERTGIRAARKYAAMLSQSQFTLCPAGKNPEQYRIWEAILAGSIPVIELPTYVGPHAEDEEEDPFEEAGPLRAEPSSDGFDAHSANNKDGATTPLQPVQVPFHPAYGMAWNCRPGSFHSFLRYTRAPVLFVRNWERELPQLLNSLSEDDIANMQERLRQWWAWFVQNWRNHLIQNLRKKHVQPF